MMLINLNRVVLGLMSLLILVGCQEEYQVELASAEETIESATFTISDTDAERMTTVHTVRVYDQDETLVWHLQRDTAAVEQGLGSLHYGSTPRGFKVAVAAASLVRGASYTLVVQGRGYGALRFAASSAGILSPLRN